MDKPKIELTWDQTEDIVRGALKHDITTLINLDGDGLLDWPKIAVEEHKGTLQVLLGAYNYYTPRQQYQTFFKEEVEAHWKKVEEILSGGPSLEELLG